MAKHTPLSNVQRTRVEILRELEQLPDDARIDESFVAAARNVSKATVQRDRQIGGGVPFIRDGGQIKTDKNGMARRFGGRVYYLKRDLVVYLNARNRTFQSTTEADLQHKTGRGAQ